MKLEAIQDEAVIVYASQSLVAFKFARDEHRFTSCCTRERLTTMPLRLGCFPGARTVLDILNSPSLFAFQVLKDEDSYALWILAHETGRLGCPSL